MRKRKVGDKKYLYGFQLVIPNGAGEMAKIMFTGEFDHRQLRRMLREVLPVRMKTEEIDFIIREFGTKLRPMTAEEMVALSSNA